MTIEVVGDARVAFHALGAFLVLSSAVPYTLNILRGRTRPRIFSWIVWTLLGAIATVAAYMGGELSSAALTAAATMETGSIVVLGWKCGNRSFERLDAYCLAGVTVGLVMWALLDSPLVGLVAALSIDTAAAIPTARHAWCKPHEEAASAYMLCAIAPLCFLAAMPKHTLLGVLYPLYLLMMNAAIAALILRVARPLAWFRLKRRMSPTSAVAAQESTQGSIVVCPEANLTYGRHAAAVRTVPALGPAASLPRSEG